MTRPVLDRAAQRLLRVLHQTATHRRPDADSIRAAAAELAKMASAPPAADRAGASFAANGRDIPLRLYSPPNRASHTLPGLVYFHGGGLVAGDLDTHDALAATLATGAGCRVVAVDYAKAPENKFPAAFDDAFAVASAAAERPNLFALDPARVGVGGDSAGGQLAALCALAARDAGCSLAFQILLCPVMDCLGRTSSRDALSVGYLLEEETMRAYWDAYRVEGLDDRDPRVAPLEARDYQGLAPAFVHVAEGDPLCDEGAQYAQRLAQAGVDCRLTRHSGLIHHFYGLGAVIPAAQSALETIVSDLRRACFEASSL